LEKQSYLPHSGEVSLAVELQCLKNEGMNKVVFGTLNARDRRDLSIMQSNVLALQMGQLSLVNKSVMEEKET
jgi:hypothetical protein